MHLVDLVKSVQSLFLNFFSNKIAIHMSIYLHNLASMQSRTSPVKLDILAPATMQPASEAACRGSRSGRGGDQQLAFLTSAGLIRTERNLPKESTPTDGGVEINHARIPFKGPDADSMQICADTLWTH